MDEKLLEKITDLSSRLEAHLQVAEFVDKNSVKEIQRLSKELKELTEKVSNVETDVTILKNNTNNKKEFFIFLFKLLTLICVIIGTIITLSKLGILNGTSTN